MSAAIFASVLAILAAQQEPTRKREDSLLRTLLRIAGLTAAPSQMRGPGGEAAAGDVWVADVDAGTAAAITKGGNYRWPVFVPRGDGALLALREDILVRIAPDGTGSVVPGIHGLVKLVGFDGQDDDSLLVVVRGSRAPLAMLSLRKRSLAPLAFDARSDAHRRMLQHVLGDEREYGPVRLYVKSEQKQGLTRAVEWTDVYLKRAGAPPRNLSHCDPVDCGEPSLSPDGHQAAFIKSTARLDH